ncbi:serine/threonine-protein kinase abkC [Spatholobus suberectus]|nr:serine/threonine-protein kinase abkC [Spatholobus suberectus]
MTTELSKREREYLLEFFKAVALQDGHTAAECILRLSKEQNCPDPKSFTRSPEGESVHTADCMQQLLEHVRHYKVNIDGNVCAVIVTTSVLEGWQRRLDPEYDVLHALQTLLFKADLAESLSYAIEGLRFEDEGLEGQRQQEEGGNECLAKSQVVELFDDDASSRKRSCARKPRAATIVHDIHDSFANCNRFSCDNKPATPEAFASH